MNWSASDIQHMTEYYAETMDESGREDARFAVLIDYLVLLLTKGKNRGTWKSVLKIFDWKISSKSDDQRIEEGTKKPDGMPMIEWAVIRKRQKMIEDAQKELDIK